MCWICRRRWQTHFMLMCVYVWLYCLCACVWIHHSLVPPTAPGSPTLIWSWWMPGSRCSSERARCSDKLTRWAGAEHTAGTEETLLIAALHVNADIPRTHCSPVARQPFKLMCKRWWKMWQKFCQHDLQQCPIRIVTWFHILSPFVINVLSVCSAFLLCYGTVYLGYTHLTFLLGKPGFKTGFHICLSWHIVQIHNNSCAVWQVEDV